MTFCKIGLTAAVHRKDSNESSACALFLAARPTVILSPVALSVYKTLYSTFLMVLATTAFFSSWNRAR